MDDPNRILTFVEYILRHSSQTPGEHYRGCSEQSEPPMPEIPLGFFKKVQTKTISINVINAVRIGIQALDPKVESSLS